MDLSENQPAEESEEVKPTEVKREEEPENIPEEVKPAEDIPAEVKKEETQEDMKPAEVSDPVSVADFSRMVSDTYKAIYDSKDACIPREKWREFQSRFNELTDYEKRVLSAFNAYRNDIVCSDRAVSAFLYTLDFLTNMNRDIILPEVEPAENNLPEEVPAENLSAAPEVQEKPVEEVHNDPSAVPEEPDELFTIVYNPTFGSTDISFTEKPSAEVIQALKKMRFKWHKMKRLWYGYKDPDTVRSAVLSAGKQEDIKPAEVKPAEKKPLSIPDKYKTYYETIFNALRECHENPKDPGRVAYYNGLLSAGSMFLPPETLSSFPRFS